ncbi:MAG: hypothetical protein LBD79_04960 [Treponema sp.]|jgi:uncharacterized protein YoxC|nr:hypothetical protein [Treponema sp.]
MGIGGAQARQPQKGLTFEDVWAMFQETDRQFQETDKKFQESRVEHDRIIEEMKKAIKEMSAHVDQVTQNVDRMSVRVDRVSNNVGGLNRSIGELIETLIAANLWEKFAAYPYRLKRAYQRVPIYDEQNKLRTDIDILLSDTEWCMAVEVKREADDKDVDHHLKRMKLIRQYPPLEVAGKRLLGAIAGGVVLPGTVEYAHKAGLFVLALTGESVALFDTPPGFAAQEW